MTTDLTEGFESGSNGATLTTSNTTLSSITGTPTFSTSQSAHGAQSMALSLAAAIAYGSKTFTGRAVCYSRMYFYYTGTIGAVTFLMNLNASGTTRAQLRINVAGTLSMRNSNTTVVWTSTTVLAAGTWYRIEWYVDNGIPAQQCRLYAGDSTTALEDSGAQVYNQGTFNLVFFGSPTSSTITCWIDDVQSRDDTWCGPASSTYPLTLAAAAASSGSLAAAASGPVSLAAAAASTAALTAAAQAPLSLTAAAASTGSLAATASAPLSLSGAGVSIGALTAHATSPLMLAGSATSSAALTAAASVPVSLAAAASTTATAAIGLTVPITLAAAGASNAAVTAHASAPLSIAAGATSTGSVAATARAALSLAAGATSSAALTIAARVAVALAGAATSTASLAASVVGHLTLAGQAVTSAVLALVRHPPPRDITLTADLEPARFTAAVEPDRFTTEGT